MERDSFSIIDYEIEELRAKRLRDTQEVVRLASMKASYLADLYCGKFSKNPLDTRPGRVLHVIK